MTEKTDEQLVSEFVSGNKQVFEVLFNRYYKKVFNLCLRFCNLDRALAEEGAQETFLQVYKSLERFGFRSSFYTWLYRVTFNTCSIVIKKHSRIRFHSLDDLDEVSSLTSVASPTDSILRKEYHSTVVSVINSLPEEQKQVMLLGPVLGHSYQEISEIVGESVTVVKGRLFRARQNFKKKFKKLFQGENFSPEKSTK